MTLFEGIVYLLVLIELVLFAIPRIRRHSWWSMGIIFILGIISLIVFSTFHWQQLPALVVASLMVIISLSGFVKTASTAKVIFTTTILITIFSFSPIISFLLPIFELPEPTGLYGVGVNTRYLLDESRPETYTENETDKRQLLITIWYPINPDEAFGLSPEPYPHDMGAVVASTLNIPTWLFSYFNRVQTHSFENLPLADTPATFPVIVFSHGMFSSRFQSIFQMEELASHGYIVVAVEHPYDAQLTFFPNGDVAESRTISPAIATYDQNVEQVAIRVADISFVINVLDQINLQDDLGIFTERLDMSRLGIFGHSYGGTTATEALAQNSRIVCGLNLDGPIYGNVRETGLDQPFLFIHTDSSFSYQPTLAELEKVSLTSEQYAQVMEDYETNVRAVYNHSRNTRYWLILNGATHYDFSDAVLYTPLLSGQLAVDRVQYILNVYTLIFFDQCLEGKNSPLLQSSSSAYPEIDFNRNPID